MSAAILEHTNLTVSDPERTAEMLCRIFDWKIRWSGSAIGDGRSIHVGGLDSYLALYVHPEMKKDEINSYLTRGGLNHLGIVVKDLDQVERRVIDYGLVPINHADYEPGRRFYFRDHDNIEYEVIEY